MINNLIFDLLLSQETQGIQMKIMWFTNVPLPTVKEHFGIKTFGSGSWLGALLNIIKNTNNIFTIVCIYPIKNVLFFKHENVQYYVIPETNDIKNSKINKSLSYCIKIIQSVKPDIIHIHGTERFYGLLSVRNNINIPTIISIQGIVQKCAEWYRYFGNNTLTDIIKMHRIVELFLLRGEFFKYLRFKKRVKIESEIFRGNRIFFGRTNWDKAFLKKTNPGAKYFCINEVIRKSFWATKWSLNECERHRIIFTNCGHPRKGVEILFKAVSVLRDEYPDLRLYLVGTISKRNGYGRYIRKKISSLKKSVVELGSLNSKSVANELHKSHIFISTSYIENSSNSVCEAQLIGMPVISAYTGGVPSLITEGKTGLLFPTGDVHMLIFRIREIFDNDQYAIELGKNAMEIARKRHDNTQIKNQLLSAYEQILAEKEQ